MLLETLGETPRQQRDLELVPHALVAQPVEQGAHRRLPGDLADPAVYPLARPVVADDVVGPYRLGHGRGQRLEFAPLPRGDDGGRLRGAQPFESRPRLGDLDGLLEGDRPYPCAAVALTHDE